MGHRHVDMRRLAKTPLLFKSKQNCHAVLPLGLFTTLITIVFNNPLPRTSATSTLLNAWTVEQEIFA